LTTERRLPFARPRREVLLLALVALVALAPLQSLSVQDGSHFCLARALLHGRLTVDDCIGTILDRSKRDGRLYSNKAPGVSALAIPAVAITGLPAPAGWHGPTDARLWATRLLVSGLPFLLAVALAGRLAEGLRPGTGGLALVAFGLGTLMAPFAVEGFDHVATAAAAFAAFLLAWNRRHLAAGLAAGLALLCEYEAAAIVLVLAAYALAHGVRAFGRYAAGVVPGALLLAAYDTAAFGAPWHNPLSYSDNSYLAEHHHGLLGVQLPNAHATWLVFFGQKGLVVISPVLAACVVGLVLLWRARLRAEAAACLAIAALFVVAECGYFDPYGGDSPGPRFLIAALPFFAVGLGPAFAAARRATLALMIPSVVACVLLELTWTRDPHYTATFWGDVVHVFGVGRGSELAAKLADTAFVWAGASRDAGALIVLACATAAVGVAVRRPGGRA
jgi:hypothetical protein